MPPRRDQASRRPDSSGGATPEAWQTDAPHPRFAPAPPGRQAAARRNRARPQ